MSGLYPLNAAPLIKMREAGLVPQLPCLVTIDAQHIGSGYIHLVVPDGLRPYRLNFSPVAGLDVVILFARKTSHLALFELYQSLNGVGVRSILAILQESDYRFCLKLNDD